MKLPSEALGVLATEDATNRTVHSHGEAPHYHHSAKCAPRQPSPGERDLNGANITRRHCTTNPHPALALQVGTPGHLLATMPGSAAGVPQWMQGADGLSHLCAPALVCRTTSGAVDHTAQPNLPLAPSPGVPGNRWCVFGCSLRNTQHELFINLLRCPTLHPAASPRPPSASGGTKTKND